MKRKIALIGSGNTFFKDEGIGLYAAKYIKENYIFEPNIIEIVDGGTLGFKLLSFLQKFDEVVIINISSDKTKKVGEITIKNRDEFLDYNLIKKTASEVEIVEMLQICSFSDTMANTQLISIVPKNIITVEVALTQELYQYWDIYIDTILNSLKELNIKIVEKKNKISLEDILHIFANPSLEYKRSF